MSGQTDQSVCKILERQQRPHIHDQETNTLYECTVCKYHTLYNWWTGRGVPSEGIDLQEMGVDGQGSTEPGDSNVDKIFFMKYPLPFLQYWYETFPLSQQETTTTGISVVSPHLLVWTQT